MSSTPDTSKRDKSPLNNLAPSNIRHIFVTFDTSHLERSALKYNRPLNMAYMFVTCDTSHLSILMLRTQISPISTPSKSSDMSLILDVSMKFKSASSPWRLSYSIIMLRSSCFVWGVTLFIVLPFLLVAIILNLFICLVCDYKIIPISITEVILLI